MEGSSQPHATVVGSGVRGKALEGEAPKARLLTKEWRRLPTLSLAEWLLLAYVLAALLVTVLAGLSGDAVLSWLVSSPDDIALGRDWSLVSSVFVVDGPLLLQLGLTTVLGLLAIRLAGGRVFWLAAVLANLLGTLLVYAAVWIADAAAVSGTAALLKEKDFGVSLVWCAALGVLFVAGRRRAHFVHIVSRPLLSVAPLLAMVAVTAVSEGLARYEHLVAFAVAVAIAWLSWDRLGSVSARRRHAEVAPESRSGAPGRRGVNAGQTTVRRPDGACGRCATGSWFSR